MDRIELIQRLRATTGLDENKLTQLTDSLIAELVTPQLFGTGARPGLLADNNCTNNCGNSCPKGGAEKEATSVRPG